MPQRCCTPQSILETLENRQFLSAVPLAAGAGGGHSAASKAVSQSLKHVRKGRRRPAAPQDALSSLLGIYSGSIQTSSGQYLGAFSLMLSQRTVEGPFFGYVGFDLPGNSQRKAVQIRVQPDGQFLATYASASLVIRISGRFDLATGAVTGRFQTWNRFSSVRGDLVLERTWPAPARVTGA